MSSEYVLQFNVKVGQHLLNVTGADTDTFKANLQWATENAAGVVATAVALEAAYAVAPLTPHVASTQVTTQQQSYAQPASGVYPGAPKPAQQAYQQPQQQVQQQNSAPAPSCAHGPMRFKAAGTSKAGNAYNAFWACTADRANQCKSVNA